MPDLLTKIKTFDAYPKTLEDFRIRTTTGAIGTPYRLYFSPVQEPKQCH